MFFLMNAKNKQTEKRIVSQKRKIVVFTKWQKLKVNFVYKLEKKYIALFPFEIFFLFSQPKVSIYVVEPSKIIDFHYDRLIEIFY